MPALALVLSACGVSTVPTPSAGTGDSDKMDKGPYTHLLTVPISAKDTKPHVRELVAGGDVLSWYPEHGFAVVGLHASANDRVGRLGSLDSNLDAVAAPETLMLEDEGDADAQTWTAWAGTWTAWAGTWTAWAGTWTAWAGTWTAWAGGEGFPDAPTENLGAYAQLRLTQGHLLSNRFGEDVVVAVIDTGVDVHHPMFEGRLAPAGDWYDFVDGDADPSEIGSTSDAAYGHGTAVAGIVLQAAPRAKILPIRVLRPDGSGDLSSVVQGIDWAISHGADVINLSLGSSTDASSLRAMVDLASSLGIYVVASAGNTGGDLLYPAAMARDGLAERFVYSVGSIAPDDTLSTFSARGPSLEVVAPGEGIVSAAPEQQLVSTAGTSFAAPFVSGALAIALSDRGSDLVDGAGAALDTGLEPFPIADLETTPGLLDVAAAQQGLSARRTPQALFVTSKFLNADDAVAKSLLEGLGYAVTVVEDKWAPSSTSGYDVVVVSSTVRSSWIATKYTAAGVPLVTWEANLYDDLGMTGTVQGEDYSWAATQSLDLAAPHALGSGLKGNVVIFDVTVASAASARPGAEAVVAGFLPDGNAALFGYAYGTSMPGAAAPARRVGLPLGEAGASSFVDDGVRLFEAAVTWATAGGRTDGN